MKKAVKKILTLVLAVTFAFSACAVAFAAGGEVTPVIVVSGMNAYPLMSEDGTTAFPIEQERMKKDIAKALPSALASVATNQWSIFAKNGLEPLRDMFEPLACDENGKSIYNVQAKSFPGSADKHAETFAHGILNESAMVRKIGQKIGLENTYFYHYDWRMNPMALADDLNELVGQVLLEKSCSRVSLVAMSFGGMITSAYMQKYGTEKLKNVVFASTAFNGVELVGRLYSGDVSIKLADVFNYLTCTNRDDAFAKCLLDICSQVTKCLQPLGDKYIANVVSVLSDPVFEKVFTDTFAHFQGCWCLMPLEYYEAAKANKEISASCSEQFFRDLDEYFYGVQAKNEELFKQCEKDGVNVYITAAYGYSGIPLTAGATNHTDNLIDTYLMSGNAVVAPYGKTLDKAFVPENQVCSLHNHRSYDGVIDASTCMLPERTWFIKDMKHVEFKINHETGTLVVYLVTSEETVDVHSSLYPQFVQLNRNTGELLSLTSNSDSDWNEDTSIFVKPFLVRIFEFLKTYINSFLGKVKA